MVNNKWSARFLELAHTVSTWSKDPSTKCGAVICQGKKVKGLGFNGYPKGIDDKDDVRTLKYEKTIHAEVNAVLDAGIAHSCLPTTIYVWPMPPCARCAAVIAQSGITEVVVGIPKGTDLTRWVDSFSIAKGIFEEAGITQEIIHYD